MAAGSEAKGNISANGAAAEHIDAAVRAFTLNYGDANACLAAAREADPGCAMADVLQAWFLTLSNDAAQVARAQEIVAKVPEAGLTAREAANLAAVRLASKGHWASAVAVLDRHLMNDPHDLAGHQCALRLDGYQGRFSREAARAARALPFWSKDDPGYGIMLSFYGFGLEEFGDFAQAEEISRRAAELEPSGYWPHHAVSHVLEMTGRPDEGVDWMESREVHWTNPKFTNGVHIWWHKALFHVELGEFDKALEIYDDRIMKVVRPVGTQLCNPTALLWRLETMGCDGGDRWAKQLELWQGQLSGMSSPFNEIHACMAAARAGDRAGYETVLAGIERSAAQDNELTAAYRDMALPISKAMERFVEEDYAAAVDGLLSARADLWRMGGSIAQRDLVDWTLTVAAIRAGDRNVALSLANERLAARPESVVNQRFLADAEAVAA